VLQAVAAKARSSTLLPLRASRGPAALRVVAFREDEKVRRQAKNVANKGQQQLQRGKQNVNKRE
jgi:hypothetical protein